MLQEGEINFINLPLGVISENVVILYLSEKVIILIAKEAYHEQLS